MSAAEEKPVHVPKGHYPEMAYPPSITPSILDYPNEEPVHLLDYWHIVLARRWSILAIVITVVTITMIATFKQTPIYEAGATIQVDRENPNILSFKDVYEIESAANDSLQTQYKILESRSLARRVIEDLHLDKVPEFQPADPGLVGGYIASVRSFLDGNKVDAGEPDRLRPYINEYLDRLNVSPVTQTRLVAVSFESKDPELAARIVNAHSKHFIEQNLLFKFEATQMASDFLSQQLVGLRANLEKADDAIQAYSRENEILFTDEGRNTEAEKLRQLEEEYTKAQAERFQKESYDHLIRTGNTDSLPQLIINPLLQTYSARLSDLRRQDSELEVTFAADYPSRKRLQNQIAEVTRNIESEKTKIIKTTQAEYAAAVERESLLVTALEKQREQVYRINQQIIQYNILKKGADSTRQLHDGLLTRLREAGVSAGLRASNIRIVDQAEPPPSPARPRKTLNLLLSLASGFLLGLGYAFLQEYLDNSIKSPDDVMKYVRLPTLATIPKLESITNRRSYGYRGYGYGRYGGSKSEGTSATVQQLKMELITHEASGSVISEAYRSLRTSLLLSSPEHSPRCVLVTSTLPSEGKTVTSVNLAISLTQTGARVALIDADMRKPRIHTIFPVEGMGLSHFLTGSGSLKEIIHTSSLPNLCVIPCGIPPPNPSELILSPRFRQMLQIFGEYFDYIVMDSPPLTNVSDARILASYADCTIMVVRAFATSRHLVSRSVEHLRGSHSKIAGVLLNDLDLHASFGYYSYYSGRYYHASEYQTKSS